MSSKDEMKVMKKILNKIKFFKDELAEEVFYAELNFCSFSRLVTVDSKIFHAYLRQKYKLKSNGGKMIDYRYLLQDKLDEVLLAGPTVRVYKRFAGDNNKIVYFLANATYDTVVIDSNGWEEKAQDEFKFIRHKSMIEIEHPQKGGNIFDLLRPFINLDDASFALCIIHLIQCFFPNNSHFVSIISAPKGTGKSTFSALIHDIIDPSIIKHSFMPTSIDELKNHLANNSLVVFDNTRKLSDVESDIFCAATTETYMTKRTLYTTSDETILRLKNVIILNGIEIIPQKSDLLERSLLFELMPISPCNRKTENEFWSNFASIKPYVMGAIFDTLSKAMHIKQTLTLTETHRMSDAYLDMVAIALALGITQEEFVELFNSNKKKLEDISRKNNAFCSAINDFFDSSGKSKIKCTITQFFTEIKEAKVCENAVIPKSPSAFSRKLNEEREELMKVGINFIIESRKDASYISISRSKK